MKKISPVNLNSDSNIDTKRLIYELNALYQSKTISLEEYNSLDNLRTVNHNLCMQLIKGLRINRLEKSQTSN